MNWIAEHWLACILLAAYSTMLLYNASVGRRVGTQLKGYYVGGRNFGGIAIGISFFATFASTNSFIGHAGKGYVYGLPWLVMALALVVFTWISWRWVGPSMRRFATRWDALTLPDYLGSRFVFGTVTDVLVDGRSSSTGGKEGSGDGLFLQQKQMRHPLRFISALVIVFCSVLYLIAIFKGAGHLFEQFLGISYTTAIAVTLVIVMVYTSIGGFVSVVRTDVVQGIIMVIGAMMIFYFVTQAAGGVGAISKLNTQPDTQFLFELNAGIPFLVLMGISLSGSLKLLVDPRQLSRYFALRDEHAVRQGFLVAIGGIVLIQFCLFPVGIYAHLILDNVADTDLIVPMMVADASIFPIWAGDILIVAIVAAAMSSMDSVLLVAASTMYKNLVAPYQVSRSDSLQILWTRLSVVGFAMVAAGFALNPPGDIVEITIFSGSLYAVCFFPAVVLGLHWRKGSANAVMGSMIVGITVLLLWLGLGLNVYVHEVFPALLASICVYVVLSIKSDAVHPELDGV